MKRIVLEPEIETGDKFFFNDEEVIAERHYSSLSFQFRKKNGELLSMKKGISDLVVMIEQRFTIIESPEEKKTCEKKTFIEGKIDALACLYEYINYFKPGSKEIKEIIKGNIDVFKKNLEQVADAGKEMEEKPQLKLRVGGVYRFENKDTESETIIRYDSSIDKFISKTGRIYWENGIRYFGGFPQKDSIFNLIEEVQLGQENITKFPAVPCKNCPQQIRLDGTYYCYLCLKKLGDWYKSKNSENLKEKEEVQPEQAEHKHEMLYFCSSCLMIAKKCRCMQFGYTGIFYKCKTCDFDSRNKKENTEKKEAVEHCGCDKSNSAVWLTSYEPKTNKYFCGKCRKEFVMPTHKPEGNPFKVGEKVIAYSSCFEKPVTSVFRGKIEKIEGDCLGVNNCGSIAWVHYKQCERVE